MGELEQAIAEKEQQRDQKAITNEYTAKIREGLNGIAAKHGDNANIMMMLGHMVESTKLIVEMIEEVEEGKVRNAQLKEQNAKMFDDLAGVQK